MIVFPVLVSTESNKAAFTIDPVNVTAETDTPIIAAVVCTTACWLSSSSVAEVTESRVTLVVKLIIGDGGEVGRSEGALAEGLTVGLAVGFVVAVAVGFLVGDRVTRVVGAMVGTTVGAVGIALGITVGAEGISVGAAVGSCDGVSFGARNIV